MGIPTLDEVEKMVRAYREEHVRRLDGYTRNDVAVACDVALALVAHVRALRVEGDVQRHTDRLRITALEEEAGRVHAKVAALEERKLPAVVLRRVAAVHAHGERLTALEAKVAALEEL